MSVLIKEMQEEDVVGVAELEAACFSEPWSENAFRGALSDADMVYMIAKENARVVGNAGLRHILGEAEITNVAVEESYRGQGIAFRIMEQLLEAGRRLGAESFTLEVRAGNRSAIALYEKLGFRTEGVRKNFYEKPKEDALIMWLR